MTTIISANVVDAVETLRGGGVLLQATEGVWGFACDPGAPGAVDRIIALKRRDEKKGFILISHDSKAFLAHMEGVQHRKEIEASWPGPHTWILPNFERFDDRITGGRNTVACRVPGHAQARQVCAGFGSIVISTSANISGSAPVLTQADAIAQFSGSVDCILEGQVDRPGQASTIHGLDLDILREPAATSGVQMNE